MLLLFLFRFAEFKNERTVKIHEQEKHPSSANLNQFICDICGMTWNTKTFLLAHRRRVHQLNKAGKPVILKPRKQTVRVKPEDPSTCHLCGKSFGWAYQLSKHIKYFHEKQFDVRCELCGLGVYCRRTLNVHLLTTHKDEPLTIKLIEEEGVKLWKCEVKGCRGVYLKKAGLEEHTRKAHSGTGGDGEVVVGQDTQQKRFTCSFCGKMFRYSYQLKVHESFHKTGAELPYSCHVCGTSFKVESYLKRHMTRFHKGKNT